ncbi:hypothetical protein PMN64_35280 [Bradyrhizobium sp. UFLA01-814]|uniref:hypothetical protein n=1 Tax=Bradyrhizobium sp. UFLA01-814 TaxID=3023480 RepID=UPI00398AA164
MLLEAGEVATAANLTMAALRATGDLEGDQADAIADIYRSLSASHAILPRTVALSLDGDKRAQLEDSKVLKTAFGDVLHFLPRRTYESYLLDGVAISSLLNEQPFFKEMPITAEKVSGWLLKHGNDEEFSATDETVFSHGWYCKVDGAKLLERLFPDVSEATEIYRKTLHSAQLTRWLLKHNRPALDVLIEYVVNLVPAALHVA